MLDQNGISTSIDNIRSIIESDFSGKVNPVIDYFEKLTEKVNLRGFDYIQQLADTVEVVVGKELWYECLKKWLVAVVANVYDEHVCRNHTCLVLSGPQGTYKTTWLENLCPGSLRNYMYTGKIKTNDKDALTNIAECFLINIDDQLHQINRKDENDLKNLITRNKINYRRPYDVYPTDYPHLASFMASVNGMEFLTDDTGSRRFLPFEITSIDMEAAENIQKDKLWREALKLYKDGFKYYFDQAEIKELNIHNQKFKATSQEEELLLEYYMKPEKRSLATHNLSGTIILSEIRRISGFNILSAKKLGSALNKHGYEKWQKDRKWVWSVIKNFDSNNENIETDHTIDENTHDNLPF